MLLSGDGMKVEVVAPLVDVADVEDAEGSSPEVLALEVLAALEDEVGDAVLVDDSSLLLSLPGVAGVAGPQPSARAGRSVRSRGARCMGFLGGSRADKSTKAAITQGIKLS
jgi:hypothetical protein